MTGVRAAALAGAVVAVTLAVLATLLALDLEGWHDAVRDGDLQQAAGSPSREAFNHDAYMPGDVGEHVLGLRDDLAFRRAVALFSLSRPGVGPLAPDDRPPARDEALQMLTETAADRDEESRAAQAANLAGILAAEGPASGTSDIAPAEIALESFRSSIALDPGPEDAKRNLEHLLRVRRLEQRAEGPRREQGRFGRSPGGAGLSPPGEGY